MSKEFIEKRYGSHSLDLAVRQQKQLSYFTTSTIQEDARVDYFEKYLDRKYYTNDVFLNWVKSIFKDANFLSFAKYFRNPNPSSKLINNRIKEPLSRVFFSEDAFFNYTINGKSVERPEELQDEFEQELFKAILFRHNDIIVHDLKDINTPYRQFVSIDKVVSIEMDGYNIEEIAYSGCVEINDEEVYGYVYLDDEKYQFYSKDKILLIDEPHDYGQCPATFIVKDCFDNDPIVKQSIFSHVRADLEMYTFFVTLQRMMYASGAFPIVTKLKTKEIANDVDDFANNGVEPMGSVQIGSQVASEARRTSGNGAGSVLQAGTVVEIPVVEKNDGSIDMELVKNFLHFYHTPVDLLKFLSGEIKNLENEIIISVLGDYHEGNEASMTELQASKSYVSKEDKLRWLSKELSFSRQASDTMMLSLKYGKENVDVDVFYGSDFFLETQDKLYDMFKKSPNAIERKNILIRLSQRRNMFNKTKSEREVILYKLLPYCSDVDFNLAVEKERVSEINFEYQTRFSYWIAMFESIYGDITFFWNNMTSPESERIIIINNLIINLIQNGKEANS